MARKKICKCGKLIPYSQIRCLECEKKHQKRTSKQSKQYDLYRRDTILTAFYKSKVWRETSKTVRAKFNSLCVMCYVEANLISKSDVVHHIEELSEHWDGRLSEDNLIPLCSSCHNKIHKSQYIDRIKVNLRQY